MILPFDDILHSKEKSQNKKQKRERPTDGRSFFLLVKGQKRFGYRLGFGHGSTTHKQTSPFPTNKVKYQSRKSCNLPSERKKPVLFCLFLVEPKGKEKKTPMK